MSINDQTRLARIVSLFALACLFALLAGCGTTRNVVSEGGDTNLMLRGNDPVAYFTDRKPIKGAREIKAEHDGLTYRFVSEAHRDMFRANPERYVPRYAGFCASGAPYALKANIDAEHFKVVDDRLYLFGSERARRHWEMDEKRNIEIGDRYWEEETKDMPFRWQNFKRYTFRVPHYKNDKELEEEWQARFGKKPGGS